jgi:hypothetical protein
MALRIPWDLHEAAVLLKVLIDVLNNEGKRNHAIAYVSQTLRELAVRHGVSIDDKFRNENGVALQMRTLEYVFTDGKSGLHVQTGWYFDIVRLYREERGKYEGLLREVKAMQVSDNKGQKGFDVWLAENDSSSAASVKSSINILSVLLLKNNTIRDGVLKITDVDVIDSLINRIKESKGIRIHSKRQKNNYLAALGVYKNYLECLAEERTNEKSDLPAVKGAVLIPEAEEENDGTLRVSFAESRTYSYTRPFELIYFDKHYPIRNWMQVYVQTVECLYDNFPDKIRSMVNKSLSEHGRIDLTDLTGADAMIAPKKLESGLYLETNCSASEIVGKIRQLMDRCGVDYSNIVISYSEKSTLSSGDSLLISSNGTTNKKADEGFLDWLVSSEGLTEATSRSYTSAINNSDFFCREHHIGTGRIYGTGTPNELAVNIALLAADEEFIEYNRLQHNRFTAALAKYKSYMGLSTDTIPARRQVAHYDNAVEIDLEERTRVLKTLSLSRFEYGYKNDSVELFRFKSSYEETNGTSCDLNDEQLLAAIRCSGFEYDGKIYLVSDEAKKRLIDEVRSLEDTGICIVYYELLYDLNLDAYFNFKIISAEMLKALLQTLLPEYRYKANYFSLSTQGQTEFELIENEIVRVWGSNALRTVDDLSVELPLIPVEKLKFTLSQRAFFIWNSVGTYTRFDLFNAGEDEIDKLTDYINAQCTQNGRVSLDDLPLDNIRANNPELSETALNNVIYKNMENRFDRNEKVLTKKGANKDTYTAVIEFCRAQNKCTYERLQHIAEDVAGVIRQPTIIEAANAAMVRVDKDNFVTDKFVSFDVDSIDTALDKVVVSDFMGMREITTFSIFPFCGYTWNLYLLESYCRRFSKKYQYETRRANSSNSGAIVSKSCLLSYHNIMAHAVARSGMELNKDEVYNFLTATGYMERKRYSSIDSLINEAARLRKRRK